MEKFKLEPIKGYQAFSRVFLSGKRFYAKNALASVHFAGCRSLIKNNGDDSRVVYYGVSVPKKRAKKAVVRNRAKRLLREVLRRAVDEICVAGQTPPFRCIVAIWYVSASRPSEISLKDAEMIVGELVDKARNYYYRKYTLV